MLLDRGALEFCANTELASFMKGCSLCTLKALFCITLQMHMAGCSVHGNWSLDVIIDSEIIVYLFL